ncbi:MAG TPA: hypothetical protein VGI50_01350 [Solirubrobacteraceae bacterium]|jgi:hypothetical protein
MRGLAQVARGLGEKASCGFAFSPSLGRSGSRLRWTVGALCSAALLAGCGGSGGQTTATTGAPHGFASIEQAAYRYSACMRQHGVPTFPDPQPISHGGEQGLKLQLPSGLKGSPAFATARRDCGGILPEVNNGGAQSAAGAHQRELGLVSFADCMRSHGVSNFPDPSAQGQLSVETLAADGVNIHLPYVINDAVACMPASHGVITRSVIANAERGGR